MMNRVRRLSMEVLDKYNDNFGENFEDNKRALMNIASITSKELKNEIAGFITKIKKQETQERLKREAAERVREEANEQEGIDDIVDTSENISETDKQADDITGESSVIKQTPEQAKDTAEQSDDVKTTTKPETSEQPKPDQA